MTKEKKFSTAPMAEKLEQIVSWLQEKKGRDILAMDVALYNGLADGICIVTGTSTKHAQGLADFVLEQSRAQKYEYLHMEGYQTAGWILLDLNDVIVHIFQDDVRQLFRLHELWPKARIVAHIADEV